MCIIYYCESKITFKKCKLMFKKMLKTAIFWYIFKNGLCIVLSVTGSINHIVKNCTFCRNDNEAPLLLNYSVSKLNKNKFELILFLSLCG